MRITPDATTATITRTIAPPHHAWTIWHMGRRLAALIRVVGRCSGRRIRRQECERKGVSGPAVAAEHHHRGRGTTHHALPALIRPLEGRTGHGGRVGDGGDVSHVHPVCNVFGSLMRRDFGLGRERRPRFLDKLKHFSEIFFFLSRKEAPHFSQTKAKMSGKTLKIPMKKYRNTTSNFFSLQPTTSAPEPRHTHRNPPSKFLQKIITK